MAQQKQGKTTTYTWILSPENGMVCLASPHSYQTVTGLWEVTKLMACHDAELAHATKKINGVLNKLEKSNKDRKRKLSFIRFRNRPFLVWARYSAIGQFDEDKTVIKELNLKVK